MLLNLFDILLNIFYTCFLETYEEAKELEKRYSKHRDSNSFSEAQTQKQNKRDHPVNWDQNNLDLIDVSDMIKKIDQTSGKGNFIKHQTYFEL